jgi:hypothetical protein
MGIAKVVAIDFAAMKGAYKGVSVTVKDEKGTKEHFVFGNSPIAAEIKQLSVGDTAELRMTQNGKYWNLGGIKKSDSASAEAPAKSGYTPKASSGGGGGNYGWSEEYIKRKDLSIARQSSVKSAIELVNAMLTQGLYKKTVTPDFVFQEVQKYTKKLEGYVTLKTDDDLLESSMESIGEGCDPDMDDSPFPG